MAKCEFCVVFYSEGGERLETDVVLIMVIPPRLL